MIQTWPPVLSKFFTWGYERFINHVCLDEQKGEEGSWKLKSFWGWIEPSQRISHFKFKYKGNVNWESLSVLSFELVDLSIMPFIVEGGKDTARVFLPETDMCSLDVMWKAVMGKYGVILFIFAFPRLPKDFDDFLYHKVFLLAVDWNS